MRIIMYIYIYNHEYEITQTTLNVIQIIHLSIFRKMVQISNSSTND